MINAEHSVDYKRVDYTRVWVYASIVSPNRNNMGHKVYVALNLSKSLIDFAQLKFNRISVKCTVKTQIKNIIIDKTSLHNIQFCFDLY